MSGEISIMQSYNMNKNGSTSKLPGITISRAKRDIDHYSKKYYAKNLDYRIMGQDSPGPAGYT